MAARMARDPGVMTDGHQTHSIARSGVIWWRFLIPAASQEPVQKSMQARNNTSKPSVLFALAACALVSALPTGAAFAAYPERLVKIVVPFAPGGGTDVVARTLAQEMSKDLGVSVIIENKPGAGTIIGTQSWCHDHSSSDA